MIDPQAQKTMNNATHSLIIAGFGGQGVLLIGNLLAYAAMHEGKAVSFLPIYGVEMRGGTADCTVVTSSQAIGSPIVDRAQAVIVMNLASLPKYEKKVEAQGLLVINSSLIEPREVSRRDIEILPVPCNDIANQTGNPKLANMVALGAFLEKTKWFQRPSILQSFEKVLDSRYHPLIPSNMKALERGVEFVQSLSKSPR
jgi:2-oxoglutarate ferredoxin oxidoreductase subunit gamma